jgi:hypothetical protein
MFFDYTKMNPDIHRFFQFSDSMKRNDKKGTLIRCYHKGLYYVCPNPQNKKLCEEIENDYSNSNSFYIGYYDYYIDESVFNDPKNWNL